MKKYAIPFFVDNYRVETIWCKSKENAIAIRNALKAEGYKFYCEVFDNHLNRFKTIDGIAEIAA